MWCGDPSRGEGRGEEGLGRFSDGRLPCHLATVVGLLSRCRIYALFCVLSYQLRNSLENVISSGVFLHRLDSTELSANALITTYTI